ncbi:MAG: hypothetical protein Q9163_005858, partial [Psora crenata]
MHLTLCAVFLLLIYVFKNIRFGAPPVGDLRWAKPAPPSQEAEIQDGSYGPICKQTTIKGPQLSGPGANSPIGKAFNQFLAGIPIPSFEAASEDCLFLDLRVPGKAIRDPSLKLPVVSWFYGGAYLFGAKDQFGSIIPFYDGIGLVQQSGGNVIFISSNYRVWFSSKIPPPPPTYSATFSYALAQLGAYGFLAGTTMEKEGLPNTGLYDQRAVLEWIQDYIGLVGGDKGQVSAWGLSAGAGSIMHHLVSFGGTQDPLFQRAVMLSPSFALMFDRKGALEDTFQNFTALAGCAGQGVACLRAASDEALDNANVKLNEAGPLGTVAVGPSPDGSLIRQLPTLELASGNFYKGLDSLVLSLVSDEADLFLPLHVDTDAEITSLIDFTFPSYAKAAGINAAIEAHYPPVMSGNGPTSNYSTVRARLKDFFGESQLQCNVRHLTDAYNGKSYNLQYSVTPGLHGIDLLPLFYKLNLDLGLFGLAEPFPLIPGFGSLSHGYQSYLVSHARSGNPNTYKKTFNIPPAITWPRPDNGGDAISGVLNVGNLGFNVITDRQSTRSRCGFWKDVAAALTASGGYAPPDSVMQSGLAGVDVGDNPSGNFGPSSGNSTRGNSTAKTTPAANPSTSGA